MSKMTLSNLKTFVATYVDSNKQAGTWNATTDNFVGLLDKIGKQITIDGVFNDPLSKINADELPFGRTIEEYFIDLTLPETYSNMTTEGAKDLTPSLPSVEEVVYSYTLGRRKIKTTMPYDNFERGCLSGAEAGNISAKIMERLTQSKTLTTFQMKKQLIGNAIDKCCAVNGGENYTYVNVAKPVDTSTGEDFIQKVKELVEAAQFAQEGGLAKALIGVAPSMTLYVDKKIMPLIQVQVLAGAFQVDKLAIPCDIQVVDDLCNSSGAYALLVDDRAIKLHQSYNAIRSTNNSDGDFTNIVNHFEYTGFISKYAYMCAFKEE